MKICVVASPGGHLTEARELLPAYASYPHFYVVDEPIALPPDMEGRTYVIHLARRNLVFFVNLAEAWSILRRERPDVILSTGAGLVVPFAIVGKLFFRTRCLFVETFARVRSPSMTGRIMYWLADRFFYQSEGLMRFFPKGTYGVSFI